MIFQIGFWEMLRDGVYYTTYVRKIQNPNPISQIKVRPDVKFDFILFLSDDCSEDAQ